MTQVQNTTEVQVSAADLAAQIEALKEAAKLARREERKAATKAKHEAEKAAAKEAKAAERAAAKATKAEAAQLAAEAKAAAVAQMTAMLAEQGITLKEFRKMAKAVEAAEAAPAEEVAAAE